MNIVEFEHTSLLEEFKDLNDRIFGRHYQEFLVTGYTEEDEAIDIKFAVAGTILDQTELDNLEITVEAIDGTREIEEMLKGNIEYRLTELFNQ